MDPRTFLPGPAIEASQPPEVGEPAPTSEAGGRPLQHAVLVFLRHAGCPFAEATARRLSHVAEAHPDVRWIAVSHATDEATSSWCRAVDLRGVELVVERERSLHAAWGLGRSSLAHFMGWRSLRAVGTLAGQGIRNRHPSGTRWQPAGTFAVDAAGRVRWRHLPAHAGELPDLEAAAGAARGESPVPQ